MQSRDLVHFWEKYSELEKEKTMGFFEIVSALFHDLTILGALAAWPVHGAFMAVIGVFTVAFENIGGFISGIF